MHHDPIRDTLRYFNIRLIETHRKYERSHINSLNDTYNGNDVCKEHFPTKDVFLTEIPEEFVEFLLNVLEELSYSCYKNNIEFSDLVYRDIVKILIQKFEKEHRDKYLQGKYPELKEIMDEYELKKRLIVNCDDL